MCRLFQQEMRKRGIDWYPSLELGSIELVTRYVAEGYGVGLTIDAPSVNPEGTRLLPLKDFPPVPFGVIWMGTLSPVGDTFVEEARSVARRMLGV